MEYLGYIGLVLLIVIIASTYFFIRQPKYYNYDKRALMALYKSNKVKDDNEKLKYETATMTSVGGRNINEDSLAYRVGDLSYWIVCDGLGGLNKGEVASSTAVDMFKEMMSQKNDYSEEFLVEIIKKINKTIIKSAENKGIRMATTIVSVVADEDSMIFGYLGDTRMYIFRKNKIAFHTKDHSVVQRYVDIGKINYDDIRHSVDRNILTRVLGVEPDCEPDSIGIPVTLYEQDSFLLCSDGFWEYILEEEMEAILEKVSSPDEWLKEMEKIILSRVENVKNDNYTAIAVFVKNSDEREVSEEAEKNVDDKSENTI